MCPHTRHVRCWTTWVWGAGLGGGAPAAALAPVAPRVAAGGEHLVVQNWSLAGTQEEGLWFRAAIHNPSFLLHILELAASG